MKKILFSLFITPSLATAVESQFNSELIRRFGPNSPIYNEPLFYSTLHMNHHKKRSKKRILKKSIQEKRTTHHR